MGTVASHRAGHRTMSCFATDDLLGDFLFLQPINRKLTRCSTVRRDRTSHHIELPPRTFEVQLFSGEITSGGMVIFHRIGHHITTPYVTMQLQYHLTSNGMAIYHRTNHRIEGTSVTMQLQYRLTSSGMVVCHHTHHCIRHCTTMLKAVKPTR